MAKRCSGGHSLYNLLRLGPGQVLGVVEPDQEPVEDWVPLGVYLRSSGWELRLLRKVLSFGVIQQPEKEDHGAVEDHAADDPFVERVLKHLRIL